jgi:hypothetical protein
LLAWLARPCSASPIDVRKRRGYRALDLFMGQRLRL